MSFIDDILAEKDFEKIRKETETNYREYLNPFALRMFKNGVISIYPFNNPKIIKIMPSLVITEDEVDFVIEAFDKSRKEIRDQESERKSKVKTI